jgi:FkbM family methyltransferase
MRRLARQVSRWLFHAVLKARIPLPSAARNLVRDWTRAVFHRSRLFQHDSRLRAAPLALRVIHQCLVRTHPADFEIYGGLLHFRSTGSPMSMHGYYVGEFEYHLVRFIVDRLCDNSIVLDIGAHHGEFAVPIAYELKRRQWTSSVWSFEPDPDNFASLQHNLDLNHLSSYARLHMVAVSDTGSDTAELLCPTDNSSNTLSSNANFALGDELPTVKRRVVRTIRLDDLDFGSKRVGIIKLDIQGSEGDALRGAQSTLGLHRPIVVVEVVESWPRAAEVKEILDDLGYTIHGLTRRGELMPIDHPRVFVSWDWIALPGPVVSGESENQHHNSVHAD